MNRHFNQMMRMQTSQDSLIYCKCGAKLPSPAAAGCNNCYPLKSANNDKPNEQKNVPSLIGSGNDALAGSGNDKLAGSGNDALVGSGNDALAGSGNAKLVGSGNDALAGFHNQFNQYQNRAHNRFDPFEQFRNRSYDRFNQLEQFGNGQKTITDFFARRISSSDDEMDFSDLNGPSEDDIDNLHEMFDCRFSDNSD